MIKNLNLFISAGESSGDAHGAEVVHSLKEIAAPDLNMQMWGMGGPKLKEAQVELVQDSSSMGIIGIADVIKQLPQLWQVEKNLIAEIKARSPNVALLIDYPGMNLRLASAIKKAVPSCKVVFYVSPQVWAWNPGRLKTIPLLVDRLLTILPFEEQLHREAGTSARYVGNPSAWSLNHLYDVDKDQVIRACGLNPNQPVIGVFPGSRNREIDFMLPIFLQAAKQLKKQKPEVQFLMVRANTITEEKFAQAFREADIDKDLIKVETSEKNHYILKSVDIAWLTSGTVTLEAACAETPLILGYKENPIFFKGYTFLRLIDKIGLPNIIANEFVSPELLQDDCNPEKWVEITKDWLETPGKLEAVRKNLHEKVVIPMQTNVNPSLNVAHEILMIHQINCTSRDNQIHMREQAHSNSKKTKMEIQDKGSLYENDFRKV